MGEDGKLRLGYWKIRGLAAPARMMCHFANLDYEDVQEKLKFDQNRRIRDDFFVKTIKVVSISRRQCSNLIFFR